VCGGLSPRAGTTTRSTKPPDIREIEERIIDWDWHDRRRNVPIVPQRSRRLVLV